MKITNAFLKKDDKHATEIGGNMHSFRKQKTTYEIVIESGHSN